MSRMSEISMEIQDALVSNGPSINSGHIEGIAKDLGVPVDWVQAVYDDMLDEELSYDDSMDGDFDSGMASAGYGTDEDYGYFGEE